MAKKKTARSTPRKREEEIYFIGVKEPIELRRGLLQSSRELLQFLQMYEKFKIVRNEKREAIALLKAQMRDLSVMAADLKKVLPAANLRAVSRNEKKVEKQPEEPKPEPKVVKQLTLVDEKPKQMSDVERLEAELADIENKLNALS